jgi:thymidylate kinase
VNVQPKENHPVTSWHHPFPPHSLQTQRDRATASHPILCGLSETVLPFHKMPFIAFLGCDGSGKSAVIEAVTAVMEKQGHQVTRGHWRPAPFASPHKPTIAADDPHGLPPRGQLSSIVKLAWLWLNWWAGWFTTLRIASKNGIVLFDRYHADLLVDSRRYRYGGPMCIARLASKCMPQPDLIIFLDASPEVLLARKQEVSSETLATSRTRYQCLCSSHSRFQVIDACHSLEDVIEGACYVISQCREQKT